MSPERQPDSPHLTDSSGKETKEKRTYRRRDKAEYGGTNPKPRRGKGEPVDSEAIVDETRDS
jgi:hypothetical protein